MTRVKIFKSVENETAELEAQINAWLAESGARVRQITGNIAPQTVPYGERSHGLTQSEFAPSDVLVIVLYEVD